MRFLILPAAFACLLSASPVAAATDEAADKSGTRVQRLEAALSVLGGNNFYACSTSSSEGVDIDRCFAIAPEGVRCLCHPEKSTSLAGDNSSLLFTNKDIKRFSFKIMDFKTADKENKGGQTETFLVYTPFLSGAATVEELKDSDAVVTPSELNRVLKKIAAQLAIERTRGRIEEMEKRLGSVK